MATEYDYKWSFWLTGKRKCPTCKGDGGWQCKDAFQPCGQCEGTGSEQKAVDLEFALSRSDVFLNMRDIMNSIAEDYRREE